VLEIMQVPKLNVYRCEREACRVENEGDEKKQFANRDSFVLHMLHKHNVRVVPLKQRRMGEVGGPKLTEAEKKNLRKLTRLIMM